MKKKLGIFLFLLCSGLVINYVADNYNFKHITTDFGFDVDYGSSSSSSSWDDDRSYSSERSSRDYDYNTRNDDYSSSSSSSHSSSSSSSSSKTYKSYTRDPKKEKIEQYIVLGSVVLFYLFEFIYVITYHKRMENRGKKLIKEKEEKYKLRYPNTPKNRKILEEAYNIFLGVQNAWMNFDYNKLEN